MKIGIDMGHCLTGADTSARGYFVESDYNRKIGKLLIDKLSSNGHTVVNCTVDGGCSDLYESLAKRVKLANDNNVDLFCSLHFNAFNGNAFGTETYLANKNAFLNEDSYKKNYDIAKRVQDRVCASCGFYNRGVKSEDFYVIYNTKALAILVEICFCDNKDDYEKLNIEKVAEAIYEGLTNDKFTGSSDNTEYVNQESNNQLFRVRKSWNDSLTQIGAYKVFENAKKECDTRSGYFVFNRKGELIYPNELSNSNDRTGEEINEYIIKEYSEIGIFTCTEEAINFRNNPIINSSNPIQGQYYRGEKVNYDYVVVTNKYVYISWISSSLGVRRYMPVRDLVNKAVWGIFE